MTALSLQKAYVSVVAATLLLLIVVPAVAAKDVVRVRSWMVSPGGAPVEEMLAMFNENQNQIEAVHEVVNWGEYLDKMLIEFAAKTAPDLILVSGQWGDYVTQNDMPVDLSPYVQRDGVRLDLFAQDQRRGPKGEIFALDYCTPAGINVIYNQDLFDQAGVSYPTEDWTWSDLVAKGSKLVRDNSAGHRERWAMDNVIYQWEACRTQLWQNDAPILTRDKTRAATDSPRFVEALQWFSDLVNEFGLSPQSKLIEGAWPNAAFSSGKLAMVYGYAIWDNYANNSFRWSNVRPPYGRVKAAMSEGKNTVTGWFIPVTSTQQDAAWEVLKYLMVDDKANALFSTWWLPAYNPRKWVLRMPPEKQNFMMTFVNDIYNHGADMDLGSAGDEVKKVVLEEMTRVTALQVSASAASSAITRRINALLSK